MAYALALESSNDYPSTGNVMLVITLIYALFSVLVIGSILNPILTYIGVEMTEKDLQTQIDLDESFYVEGENSNRLLNCGEKLKKNIFNLNKKYFRPIFIVEKGQSEIIADMDINEASTLQTNAEEIKRKSDSQLFEVNLDGNDIKLTRLNKIRSSDQERQDLNNSI